MGGCLRQALLEVKDAIMRADHDVLTDTLWMPEDVLKGATVVDRIDIALSLTPQEHTTCERCQGNGEIVTDWQRYRHPHECDIGDEAVAECPDCGGEGIIDWFSHVVGFLVKQGMLDASGEYHINDVMSALTDNYEPTADHLRRAVEGIADDYMTSETHHPGWVLIPEAKFEAIRAASSGGVAP